MVPPNTTNQHARRTQSQPLPGTRMNPVLCIIVSLILLGLLVGLAILITYLILRPKRLIYTVEAAAVQEFVIGQNDDHINAKFSYVIKSYNPEKHISVRYHFMRISTAHHNQSVAHKEISPFKQHPKNETRIETQLVSHNVALSKFNAKDLRAEKSKGTIEMEVFITARVSYKTWIFRSRRRTLKAKCSPIMINATASSLDGFQKITGSSVPSNLLSNFSRSHESNPSIKLLFHDPATNKNSKQIGVFKQVTRPNTEAPVTSCCRLFGFDLTSTYAPAHIPPDKQVNSVESKNSGSTTYQDPNSSKSPKEHKQQTSTTVYELPNSGLVS